MTFTSFEYIPRMTYYGGYAVRMEMCIPDPNECPFPYIEIFDLDRIEDVRDAIDRGYLDVAASYGDLYRLIDLDIKADGAEESLPRYERYRTRMRDANGYVVEVQTELSGIGSPWAAGVSLDDSLRMKAACEALEVGDLETAALYDKVYKLERVDVEPAMTPWKPSERQAATRSAR